MISYTTQTAYDAIREYFSRPEAVISVGKVMTSLGKEIEECVYRRELEDGTVTRCAVGCLIPDELYTPDMESRTADQLLGVIRTSGRSDLRPETLAGLHELLDGVNLQFLTRAQTAHDSRMYAWEGGAADFVKELDEIAETYGLAVSA